VKQNEHEQFKRKQIEYEQTIKSLQHANELLTLNNRTANIHDENVQRQQKELEEYQRVRVCLMNMRSACCFCLSIR
jgi:hypothetical protein